MGEPRRLSVAFAESHPDEAAHVLGALSGPESAAFLAALPARLAGAVVKHMSPQFGARCAQAMDDPELTALVEALGPQAASALLQHMGPQRQARVLEQLPVSMAVAVRLLVGYPKETAGSSMDPFPLALSAETPAAEALDELRRFEGEPGDVVFAIGLERKLLGVVAMGGLLRAPPRETIAVIMRQPAPSVSALTPLASIRGHRGWLETPALAVVERQDRLVGALRYPVLEAAIAERQATASDRTGSDALAGLGGAYWQTLESLARLAVNLMPPVRPVVRREEKDHER
jgi:magnesium transporter